MFLTDNDYNQLIQEDDLDLVQQSDPYLRLKMEETAIEEMSGYLRNKYDVAAIFVEADDIDNDTRNRTIVMFCMDICLYHLHSSVPSRLVPELREKRYENAIKWLEKVCTGKINPELPLIGGTDVDSGNPIKFGTSDNINSW